MGHRVHTSAHGQLRSSIIVGLCVLEERSNSQIPPIVLFCVAYEGLSPSMHNSTIHYILPTNMLIVIAHQ